MPIGSRCCSEHALFFSSLSRFPHKRALKFSTSTSMAGTPTLVTTLWPADGGVHFDGQWRRSKIMTRWQQYQLRPGLNLQASKSILLTLGYAYTRTYPYGEFPVTDAIPEHRIYEQALVRHRRDRVTLLQRIRMEQRFVRYPSTHDRSWTYQNRFRYMLKAEFPLRVRRDRTLAWYLPVYDEILLGIPPNFGARSFDQNRLFAGIGYSGARGNVEVGRLIQFLGQRNGRVFEFNNTLCL